MKIENGKKVKVHYTGKFEDGTVFDSSEGKEPLEFTIGEKKVIPGFEKAVRKMKVGEEANVVIPAKEAYGEPDASLRKEFTKERFKEQPLKEGLIFSFAKDGKRFLGKVHEIRDNKVIVDFNHPLAGKSLHFHLRLVDVT